MVGTKPVIMVAAGVVISNAAGEVLMQHRADGSGWGSSVGLWSWANRLKRRREVLEETGLTVGRLELFGVFSVSELLTYPNGDRAQTITVSYLTDVVHGTLQTDAEGLELRYFSLSALPEPLFAPSKPIREGDASVFREALVGLVVEAPDLFGNPAKR